MAADNGGDDTLAPVIPLFGATDADSSADPRAKRVETTPQWRTTWDDDDLHDDLSSMADEVDECTQIEREIAERNLTRKLRTRQLSVSEARSVVAERDLDETMIEAVLHDFVRRGYLDDRALAEQLVRAGVERKGQGRTVIAQSLAKRKIPREIVDAALAALPDDDAERALEFARQKARSMRGLEHDVALRRLIGQLARRGYGAAAMDAARQALDELAQ
ncbi:regulatory protein RecX [Microbacterium horticulturae]|uniref:Regulatory protein RecX n=1 Tax=Microbacterium horticulturae TaxID=3028316 RepID=A0ABY8BX70_9MICO|nr:regulatory protein RecX [Microbacterium sp. KACC 23027]WEG07717.1 regulatory protein RecX [Microbacterium sp. KACC 23027]